MSAIPSDPDALNAVARLAGGVILRIDRHAARAWCSDTAPGLLGHDPDGLAASWAGDLDVVHGNDREAVARALAEARTDPAEICITMMRGDGATIAVTAAISRPAGDDVVLVLLRDAGARIRDAQSQSIWAELSREARFRNDRTSNSVTFDDGLARVFGIALAGSHTVPTGYIDHIHPDDRTVAVDGFYDLVGGRDTVGAFDYRLRRGDGTYAFVRERVAVQRDAAGQAQTVHSTVSDISDWQEERRRRDLLTRTTGQVVADYDAITDRLTFSGATMACLGYAPEELPHRIAAFLEMVHPADRATLQSALGVLRSDKRRSEPVEIYYRLRRADGSYGHFLDRGLPIADEQGQTVGVIVVLTDVSDLLQKQDQLATLADIASDATYEYFHDEGRIVLGTGFASRFGHDLTGPHSFPSPWADAIHPDDRDTLIAGFLAFAEGDAPRMICEYRIRHGDGTWRIVTEKIAALRDDTGRATLIIGSLDDVTDQRRSAARLQQAVDALDSGFALYDDQQRLVLYNRSFAQMNAGIADLIRPGVRRDELLAALIDRNQLLVPEKAVFSQLPRDQTPVNATVTQATGRIYDVRFNQTADGDWVSLLTDVTDVMQQREKLRAIFEVSADAVFEYDPGGKRVVFDAGFRTNFGYDWHGEMPLPSPWADTVHPDDRADLARRTAAFVDSAEKRMDSRYRMRHADGRWVHVAERLIALRDDTGRAVLLIGAVADVTEQHLQEEQLLAAQKMESVGRISGGIAHDFNNLLAVIMGNAELLSVSSDDPVLREFTEEIIAASRRGAELTRRLLSFARKSRLYPKVVDLNDLVDDLGRMFARVLPETVRLDTRLSPDLWRSRVDPAFLESALLNLVLNARDAMPQGGTLTIESCNLDIGESYGIERAETVVPGRYAMLAISDTGIGMDRDMLDNVVEPFFTTKGPHMGTGLGLSMVDGFVRQSGGVLRIYSEPGVGTTVKLLLPAVADDTNVAHAPVPSEDRAQTDLSLRVLLVEDEEKVRNIVARILRDIGLHVTEAASGDVALALFQQMAHPPDVLLTDVVMPGTLQGPMLARRLKDLRPDLAIIFMSGYANEAAINGNGLRADDLFLMKPIERRKLLDLIDRIRSGDDD